MSLGVDFFIDFDPKMVPKRDPIFMERQFYWLLKDVLNKILTFEVEMEPKPDTKRN